MPITIMFFCLSKISEQKKKFYKYQNFKIRLWSFVQDKCFLVLLMKLKKTETFIEGISWADDQKLVNNEKGKTPLRKMAVETLNYILLAACLQEIVFSAMVYSNGYKVQIIVNTRLVLGRTSFLLSIDNIS